jgi:hypothetical protein
MVEGVFMFARCAVSEVFRPLSSALSANKK